VARSGIGVNVANDIRSTPRSCDRAGLLPDVDVSTCSIARSCLRPSPGTASAHRFGSRAFARRDWLRGRQIRTPLAGRRGHSSRRGVAGGYRAAPRCATVTSSYLSAPCPRLRYGNTEDSVFAGERSRALACTRPRTAPGRVGRLHQHLTQPASTQEVRAAVVASVAPQDNIFVTASKRRRRANRCGWTGAPSCDDSRRRRADDRRRRRIVTRFGRICSSGHDRRRLRHPTTFDCIIVDNERAGASSRRHHAGSDRVRRLVRRTAKLPATELLPPTHRSDAGPRLHSLGSCGNGGSVDGLVRRIKAECRRKNSRRRGDAVSPCVAPLARKSNRCIRFDAGGLRIAARLGLEW